MAFFFLCFASLILSLVVAWFAWRQRRFAGAGTFAVLSIFQALWTLGYIGELAATGIKQKMFWDSFQNIGSFSIPVALLIFSWEYGRARLTNLWRWWIVLMTLPVIYMVIVFVDPLGGYSRLNAVIIPASETSPFAALQYGYPRALYWMFIYVYLVLAVALIELIRRIIMARGVFRTQLILVTAGLLIPIIASIATLAGVVEIYGQRDISPLTFGFSSLIVLATLRRYRLFDLVPVARERVAEVMRDSVLTLDSQDRVVDFNPSARRMLGAEITLLGKSAGDSYPWLAAHLDHTDKEIDVELGDKTQPTYYNVTFTPLTDSVGQNNGTLVLVRDVTARTRAEKALETLYSEQVQVAEKLRAVDNIKSQFLASMSHELRTPLNAILNFTEFVALGILGEVNDAQVDALNKSIDSGRHLLSLINDVLDMTKIESGMMKLFVEPDINIHAELRQVIATAETLLSEKPEVTFIKDIDANLPTLLGDRRRLRQVLLNLISNAVKFTDEGSVTLSIKHRGENMLFAVTDTGPGIALADQSMIFEPFRQTETGIRHATGTGLGLPISKRLVESHGGRLWVESEPGDGAAFYFTIPVSSPELTQQLLDTAKA